MNCTFDLESDELYSIKWYRNSVEFYRYLPSDNPPAQKYDLHGAYLDLGVSRLGNIYLYRTDLNSEGTYKCEVSAEAPSFQTVRDEREMKVYVLPEHGPKIHGTKPHYNIGDDVNVTCSSGSSKPPAELKWYINEKEVPDHLQVKYESFRQLDGLQSTSLGLKFRVEPVRFWEGAIKLRCLAILTHSYSTSREEIAFNNDIHPSSLQSGISPTSEGPTIRGTHRHYKTGDRVNATCTSHKSVQSATVKWYINDYEALSTSLVRYPLISYPDGQKSTVVGLSFSVVQDHFVKDELRLKCVSTLSKIINVTSEEAIVESTQQASGLQISQTTGALYNQAIRHLHVLRLLGICALIACVS